MVGGYKIIDLQEVAVTSGTTAITGLQNEIKYGMAGKKPILFRGLKVGATVYPPVFIAPYASSTNIVFALGNKTITVSNADVITIS